MPQATDPLSELFEPDLLREMHEAGRLVHLPKDAVILEIGQNIKSMPVLLSGTVKISRTDDEGRELLLYYVNPLESCAMTFTCCMQHQVSEIRAVAEEPVEMVALPITKMDEWMNRYPSWKSFVMKTMRVRFNDLLTTIDQIAFQKLDERLVNYLREKSRATGTALINLSHEQIANELATSREVVSRLLKKLERDGRLLLYRGQIKLLPGL